jgi:hypothetical protein
MFRIYIWICNVWVLDLFVFDYLDLIYFRFVFGFGFVTILNFGLKTYTKTDSKEAKTSQKPIQNLPKTQIEK